MKPMQSLSRLSSLAALVLPALLAGCGPTAGGDPAPPPEPPASIPYDTLSAYGFFAGTLADLEPAPSVLPYDVVSPLWSDGAGKARFVLLPEGQKAEFGADETWTIPEGTIVIKSFWFPEDKRAPAGARRHVETRLLIKDSSVDEGWTAHTYVWNDEQTEAVRKIAGKQVTIEFIDENGAPATQAYLVPNTNQCGNCHARDDRYELLGLVTPQVNFDLADGGATKNQLARLAEAGVFSTPPPAPAELPAFPAPFGDAPLEARARSYLHANCSHCHRPGGGGGSSGLVLLAWETNPAKFGVCKGSVAAGSGTGSHEFDIVPGFPDESIMTFRMSSTDPEIKMPEIPNLLPDPSGVELISSWIAAMQPPGCP
jgi:uncharacterized repeat protein (TIGR03806 family)